MNYCQKTLSACLLGMAALVVGASPAFAAGVPSLGTASNFAVLSAAPGGGGAVTCTNTPPPPTYPGSFRLLPVSLPVSSVLIPRKTRLKATA